MNRTIKPLLSCCCAIAFCVVSVVAQNSTKPEAQNQTSPTPSRTRNVTKKGVKKTGRNATKPAAASVEEAQKTAAEATPAQNPAAVDKAGSEKEQQKDEVPQTETLDAKAEPATTVTPEKKDPQATLRDQIENAATPVEKSRLRMQLVELLVAGGKTPDAINELRAISFEDHFDPQGLYNAGNALARLGDSDGAIAAYHKAIEQKKGRYPRALNNIGVVLLRLGRWDEAQEALVSALRLEGFRYAEASYNLGRLYAARGEMDLAVREWRRALAVNPDHKAAAQAISNSGAQGRISVAADLKPVKLPRVVPAERQPVETVSARPAKATRSPNPIKSLTVDPETYDYLQRARSARDRDRHEDAIANYRRVISRMGGYFAPANLELSYSLINLKRTDEAIAVLVPLTEQDGPRYPISYYHLARLYEGRGDLKLAEQNFSLAANYYRNDNAQFLLDVSRVREKLGDYQGALTVLEEYLATLEQKKLRPNWSDDRLSSLKQRIAAAQKKP